MPRTAAMIAVLALVACAKTDQQIDNSPRPTSQRSIAPATPSPATQSAGGEVMPPEGQTPDVAINDDAPAVPDLRDDSVADPLELVTANIDTTLMLASWLKSHPADRVTTIAPVGNSIDDQFCRTAVAKTRLGGVTLVRSALFYMPGPPKGEMLPANLSDGAENHCQLGAMVLASVALTRK